MSVLRVPFDNIIEVNDRFLVFLYHLECFCSLVNVPNVAWYHLDAFGEGVNGLLKLFEVAVSETNVVVDVSLVGQVRFVLQSKLEGLCRPLVPLEGVICESQFVEYLRLNWINSVRHLQIVDSVYILPQVEEALRSVHQE